MIPAQDGITSYTVFALDSAMRYSSIALLLVYPQQERIIIKRIIDVDNRCRNKPHGLMYEQIFQAVCEQAREADVFVRECGGCKLRETNKTLFEVAGITELALWKARETKFNDITPMRVKELLTGDERATKGQVARALPQYVGAYPYTMYDQSDAVAIGLAYLKLHGMIDLEAVRQRRMMEQCCMESCLTLATV